MSRGIRSRAEPGLAKACLIERGQEGGSDDGIRQEEYREKDGEEGRRSAKGRAGFELPPTLQAYSKQVQKRLAALEKEIERAQVEARRSAARLLRKASHELGRLEAGGEKGWHKLASDAQKQALKLLSQLEKAIAPAGAHKKAARSVKRAVKPTTSAAKSGASAVKDAAAKAAASVTPS